MRRVLPVFILLVLIALAVVALAVPYLAERTYGAAAGYLSAAQRWRYAAQMLWYDGLLTSPADPYGTEQDFTIGAGETVDSVAIRLQAAGLIRDASAFRAYLIYSGLDLSIQAGEYRLSPALSAMQIAAALQDATPVAVTFVVLPGWRMEEIADALPTSGLSFSGQEFMDAARRVPPDLDFLAGAATTEGFLLPGNYELPRAITADQLVLTLVRAFGLELNTALREAYSRQGLSVRDAVILASIVQREAVVADEQPLIASVFFNRLAAGMKLESDPTVQYAIGGQDDRGWWPVPLTLGDLRFDSPYNTYVYAGLPPAPIANPGMDALLAVAYPAQTPYYYFRARCDGSGRHAFAETFEEHLQNACP